VNEEEEEEEELNEVTWLWKSDEKEAHQPGQGVNMLSYVRISAGRAIKWPELALRTTMLFETYGKRSLKKVSDWNV
jgi:hypothetical protein